MRRAVANWLPFFVFTCKPPQCKPIIALILIAFCWRARRDSNPQLPDSNLVLYRGATTCLIIPCSSAPTLSNNIIQKGLAFVRDQSDSNMTISLAFLAPDLVRAAIEGRLPHGMGVARLCDMPAEWSRQHQMLGLPAP